MADGEDKMETAEKELLAIKLVVETLKSLNDESKRRVLGYVASLFSVNDARPQQMMAPPPMGARVRSTPLPPNVDPNAVRQAIDAAGLPRSR